MRNPAALLVLPLAELLDRSLIEAARQTAQWIQSWEDWYCWLCKG
ncbi:hypothetical protein BH09ACT8_BH09ACT8_11940 [soil metagenome]